jgi:drug/metabolite transporter (DMT)-like permease
MGETLALLSALLFGLGGLLTRTAIASVAREQGFLISIAANAVSLYLLGFAQLLFDDVGQVSPRAIAFFVAGGICGTLIGRWASFGAIQQIGPSRAALYKNTQPVFTTAIAVILLGESLTGLGVLSGLAILCGIWIVSAEPLIGQDGASWGIVSGGRRWGVAFGFLSAIGFAVGNVLKKAGMESWGEPLIAAVIGVTTALLLSVLCARPGVLRLSINGRRRRGYWQFVALGMVTSGAQISFLASLIFTEVWIVSVIMSIEPVLLVMMSCLFLPGREHFTAWSWWGSGLVAGGLAVFLVAA